MSEELVYDPKSKELIKTKIYEFLYAPVDRDFDKRLRTIITKNSLLHGNDQQWLAYKGEYYQFDEAKARPRPVNRLKPELKPVMDEYLADIKKLNEYELPYVLGFITQVLNSSNSVQDYFKVFPESTHKPIQALIHRCACKSAALTPELVEKLTEQNAVPIELMKKRMVLNLLI